MYDPPEDESYSEWIEIFNPSDDSISLENWSLCNDAVEPGYISHLDENAYLDTGFELPPGSYAVITDGGSGTLIYSFNVSGIAFHVNSSNLCSGLSNENETIIISNSTYNYSLYYDKEFGGSNSNLTLCLYDSLRECMPTPGRENTIQINGSSENESGSETVNQTGNQTGETYQNQSFNSTSGILNCNYSFQITSPEIVNATQSFDYYFIINDTLCLNSAITIEYWIEDLFGNVIKEKVNTTRDMDCLETISRSWTPPSIQGSESYVILFRLVNSSCQSGYASASKTFSVKGYLEQTSNITISLPDSSKKFGQILYVDLEIYRGNTAKYAINVWTEISGEKSSLTTTVHVNEKYKKYEMRIPVQIKGNCDSEINSGLHDLFVEGIDIKNNAQVTIEGLSDCPSPIYISTSSGSSASIASVSKTTVQNKTKNQPLYIKIDSSNSSANPGDEIMTGIFLSNAYSRALNISLYSYIFSGTSLASEGGWTPNKLSLSLGPGKNTTVYLMNKIKLSASGAYLIRAKVNALEINESYYDTKNIDITESREQTEKIVNSSEPQISPAAINVEINGPQQVFQVPDSSQSKKNPITGLSTARENDFLNIMENWPSMYFIKQLLALFNFRFVEL